MKHSIRISKKVGLLIILFSVFSQSSFAQIKSKVDGSWHEASTWEGGVVPVGKDDVLITHNINMPVWYAAKAKKLTIKRGASLTTIGGNAGGTANGSISYSGTLTNEGELIANNSGRLLGPGKIVNTGTINFAAVQGGNWMHVVNSDIQNKGTINWSACNVTSKTKGGNTWANCGQYNRTAPPNNKMSNITISDCSPVTVYQHYNYGGKSQSFGEGYHAGYLKIGNDVISSLKIEKGWRVILYEHGPATGRALVLTANTPRLGDYKFNDIVSNLKVEKIPEGVYGIGDEHPCGIVISVDKSGKNGMVVATEDIVDKDIDATTKLVKAMGNGWSLPDPETMETLYKNFKNSKQIELKNGWYWTSKWAGSNYYVGLNMADGKTSNRFAGEFQRCRPVKAFGPNTKCEEEIIVLPEEIRIHAFSVHGGKAEKDDYWFGFNNGQNRARIVSTAQVKKGANIMDIETVSLGGDTYGFRVKNAGNGSFYLTVLDNKEVHMVPVKGEVPANARFVSRNPLTSAEGSKEYRSFESVKFPKHFLRHSAYVLYVHTTNGSELFNQDASWRIETLKASAQETKASPIRKRIKKTF